MALSFNSHLPAPYARRPQDIFESVSSVSIEDSGAHVTASSDLFSDLTLSGRAKPEAVELQFRIRNEEQAINSIRSAEFSLVEVRSILIRLRELAYGFSLDTQSDEERKLVSDQFDELNIATRRVFKVFNSDISTTTISDPKGSESHELLLSNKGIEIAHIVSAGAEPGLYVFSPIEENTGIKLSDGSNSQTIKFADLRDKDEADKITSIVLNFDQLGIIATLNVESPFDAVGALADEGITGWQFVVTEAFEATQDEFLVSKRTLEEFIARIKFLSDFFNIESKSPSIHSVIAHLEEALEQESRIRGNLGYVLNRIASNIKTIERQIEKLEISVDKIRDSTTADTVLQRSQSRIVLQRADRLLVHAQSVDPARVLRLLEV